MPRGREGGKAIWTHIGATWARTDGKGFNLRIKAVPTGGRITLRVFAENME